MSDRALVVADAEGIIRMWSSGAEALFGYPAADALGRSLDLLIPARFRERHWRAFHAAMATGVIETDGQTVWAGPSAGSIVMSPNVGAGPRPVADARRGDATLEIALTERPRLPDQRPADTIRRSYKR